MCTQTQPTCRLRGASALCMHSTPRSQICCFPCSKMVPFGGTSTIPLLASSAASPPACLPCVCPVGSLWARSCVLPALCLLVYTSWHPPCAHHAPTSCFSAPSVCLLGFRAVCVELSPVKTAFSHFSVEAAGQRRRGRTGWGLGGAFWACILQTGRKMPRGSPKPQLPDPRGQQD